MMRRWLRVVWTASLALAALAWAVPALAQNGTMNGRVIDVERRMTDRDGKPIGGGKQRDTMGMSKDPEDHLLGMAQAIVTLELTGEAPRKWQVVTDAFGDWYKSGLPPGTYDISVRREWRDPIQGRTTDPGNLVVFIAEMKGVVLQPKEKLRVPNIDAMTEEAVAAGRSAPVMTNMSNAEVEAANKRTAELEAMLKDAMAAADAGNHEGAIAQFEAFAKKMEEGGNTCAVCYAKIGESQVALKNVDKAEAAFLKAIELDPDLPAPYAHLATIYNAQRKFDEAAKMNDKATELIAKAAGGEAGGDSTAAYNSGIIHWNAGQYEDAKADFAKAVQMDPKNANAQYYLGMAIFNLASTGKANMADAKGPFQEYLKLAPTGEFAEVAKAILATIK
jgi:Tfp pilus assembly protein PilF